MITGFLPVKTLSRLIEPAERYDRGTRPFSNQALKAMIIPLLIEQLLQMVVGMMDTVMVSHAGEAAVSGVSLDTMFYTIFIYLFTAIGAGELASFEYLGSLMKAFRAAHPRVRYDVISGAADEITDGMDRGLIDISLLLEPVNISKYEFIRLPVTEHWACAMRPDDPLAEKAAITAGELAQRELILPRRMSVQSELAHWFGRKWSKLNVFCAQSLTTNCSMIVSQGPQISLIIEGSLPDRDRSKIITKRLEPDLQASSVVCWKRDAPAPAAAAAFIDFLGGQTESIPR